MCPRCLGKGVVNEKDIKRMGMQMKWSPGECAYCNKKGKVSEKQLKGIDYKMTYFSSNLSNIERRMLLNKNPNSLAIAKMVDEKIDSYIKQIRYLSEKIGLTKEQIVKYFSETDSSFLHMEEKELHKFIEKVLIN